MKKLDLGPTGRTVAARVSQMRSSRGLTFAALSKRLGDAGHPIPALGLRRIEAGARNVSADDLMALAAALEISPVRMLVSDDWTDPLGTGLPPDLEREEFVEWVFDRRAISRPERVRFYREEAEDAGQKFDFFMTFAERAAEEADRERLREDALVQAERRQRALSRLAELEANG